jgi:alpha-glucosidase
MNSAIFKRLTLSFYFLFASAIGFGQQVSVKSPDGKISFIINIEDQKTYYRIESEGKAVLKKSEMGLRVNGAAYNTAKMLKLDKQIVVKETLATRGVHAKGVHYAREATVNFSSSRPGNDFEVNIAVFNDGAAFRYRVPNHAAATVEQDLTQFHLPENSSAWWQDDVQNYEGGYRKNALQDIKDLQVIGLPITFQLADHKKYVTINEAGLEDFAGLHLVKKSTDSFIGALAGKINTTGNIISSWRVVQVSDNLNALVNSDIIASLSTAPDPGIFPQGFDTKWIRPGKCVWSWMTPTRSVTPENMRKFTDLASQLNIPYNLVDDGWGKWKSADKDSWQLMKDLVDYSRPKKVNIWVWAAYPDNNGLKGLKDSIYMKEFFRQCKDIGIVGLKVDFMSSESQEMMSFYRRALKEAAKLELMLDFHGVSKPTGLSNTWPNEMTREAVRGLEYEGSTDYAEHNTILPFTRYLAGPGDYTPMSFQPYVSKTTLAHQAATVMIFTSPLLVLGADPETLLKSPALSFIKQTPSVWDETIVLPSSRVGEIAVFARRSGCKWFVGVINNRDSKDMAAMFRNRMYSR